MVLVLLLNLISGDLDLKVPEMFNMVIERN